MYGNADSKHDKKNQNSMSLNSLYGTSSKSVHNPS